MKKIDLIKYINGELNSSQSALVKEWIESSESNKRYFDCLKESYTLMTLPEERASEEDFADFLNEYSLNDAPQPITSKKIHSKNIFRIAAAISAVAAVVLFAVWVTLDTKPKNSKYSNIIANNTSELLLETLPDGSTIGLSPNSEIRYNDEFNTSNQN